MNWRYNVFKGEECVYPHMVDLVSMSSEDRRGLTAHLYKTSGARGRQEPTDIGRFACLMADGIAEHEGVTHLRVKSDVTVFVTEVAEV